ncbi:LysR family transcriptional regulator [Thalassospira permensis NBRC 106175]|jgi:DNA-binding transcriptional LysR family regulator|uniref:LysR family transcriptional regulator n=2 Tax=Thalassospira TaxID=168934 RepID=A0ABR4TPB4_9PROT|nr:LysR family transcriptional regulator [Thalassospira permensis NBRC 106175]
MPMDRAAEMEIFVHAVEEGSFSAAARTMRLSPSAVSKYISRLEDRLGARLLMRTTRQLSLTEEGRAFYERARTILNEIEEAEEVVTQLYAAPRGTLRINASVAFTKYQVVPLIPEFLARYPDVRIELTLDDKFTDLVNDGYDLAIRLSALEDSSLIARKYAVNRRMIVASPEYLEKNGIPRKPQELENHDCLHLSSRESFNDWHFDTPEGHVSFRAQGSFSANDGDALHEAVVAGLGMARLAEYLVHEDIRAGRLTPVLTEYVHDLAWISAVYPHKRHLSPKVRAFVDFLAEKFTPIPPWELGLRDARSVRKPEAVTETKAIAAPVTGQQS